MDARLVAYGVAIGAVGLALWYAARRAGSVAAAVGQAIDPTSRDNLAYRGVNAIGDAVVPPLGPGRYADGSWSLGAWIFDVANGMPTTEPAAAPAYVPDASSAAPYFGA